MDDLQSFLRQRNVPESTIEKIELEKQRPQRQHNCRKGQIHAHRPGFNWSLHSSRGFPKRQTLEQRRQTQLQERTSPRPQDWIQLVLTLVKRISKKTDTLRISKHLINSITNGY